jgi:hypothetical protein
VIWCDLVWCQVVWCGVVWCGVVWCGVVMWHDGVMWCDMCFCAFPFLVFPDFSLDATSINSLSLFGVQPALSVRVKIGTVACSKRIQRSLTDSKWNALCLRVKVQIVGIETEGLHLWRAVQSYMKHSLDFVEFLVVKGVSNHAHTKQDFSKPMALRHSLLWARRFLKQRACDLYHSNEGTVRSNCSWCDPFGKKTQNLRRSPQSITFRI